MELSKNHKLSWMFLLAGVVVAGMAIYLIVN